jgi:hypothetical protein
MMGLLVREGWPRCQLRACQRPVARVIELRLIADWTAAEACGGPSLPVAACWRHAAELERCQRAEQAAHRDLLAQARALQVAFSTATALRRELAEARAGGRLEVHA